MGRSPRAAAKSNTPGDLPVERLRRRAARFVRGHAAHVGGGEGAERRGVARPPLHDQRQQRLAHRRDGDLTGLLGDSHAPPIIAPAGRPATLPRARRPRRRPLPGGRGADARRRAEPGRTTGGIDRIHPIHTDCALRLHASPGWSYDPATGGGRRAGAAPNNRVNQNHGRCAAMLSRAEKVKLSRRDMLKLSAGGAGLFALTASGFAVPRGVASGGPVYLEAFPTSPLITDPFRDTPANALPIPQALRPMDAGYCGAAWSKGENPYDRNKQDCLRGRRIGPLTSGDYLTKYQRQLGHPPDLPGRHAPRRRAALQLDEAPGQRRLQAGRLPDPGCCPHGTTSPRRWCSRSTASARTSSRRTAGRAELPSSTITGFNGTFPGPRINAMYGLPSLVRFENQLDDNPRASTSRTSARRTAPSSPTSTTATPRRSRTASRTTPTTASADERADIEATHYRAAWEPGEWVNQMYLGYPAGGDDREKQSFFWFHDHVHGHTGANVYKGMVGLMPQYDPILDNGDERYGLRLPGVKRGLQGRHVRRRLRHPAGALRLPPRRRQDAAQGRPQRQRRDPPRSGGASRTSATSPTTASWATS